MAVVPASRLRRALITRPADRADDLIRALSARGIESLHIPMLDILPLDEQGDAGILRRTRSLIADLDRYDALIFISVNAVTFGLREIDRLWPQWPVGQQVFAIGAATAQALAECGLPLPVVTGQRDSESLLDAPQLQQLKGRRILIVRGVGGRELLADTLRERGAQVDYAECYKRGLPDHDRLALLQRLDQANVDLVVANSAETLENLARFLPENHPVFRQVLLVPGRRVAAVAEQLGYANVRVADNAGLDATLAALDALDDDKKKRGCE